MATKEEIINVLRTVNDPELHMDVWTLELIRNIDIGESLVKINMTFTSPMCPYGPQLVDSIQRSVQALDGIEKVDIEVEFDPPWEPSAELRATLGV